MKVYELLKGTESVCTLLDSNGCKCSDVRNLQMFEDWVRLRKEGHKYDFIVHYLSTQYEVSLSSVERITRRLNQDVKM